jgi:hypothetical protein
MFFERHSTFFETLRLRDLEGVHVIPEEKTSVGKLLVPGLNPYSASINGFLSGERRDQRPRHDESQGQTYISHGISAVVSIPDDA